VWKLIRITGVDLNFQFPAGWINARRIKYEQGFTKPAPRDFVGYGPLTEPEALAIYNFTLAHNFRLILTYHTQGKVIFWQFQDYNPDGSYYIGTQFANVSGYSLESTPYNSSFAGYKDWFIEHYNRPGYTIEAGLGTNPLPISQFDEIYSDNLGIFVLGALL
jgi:g-D-glutamyl-meso-diaminopimelate peptidase